MEFDIHDIDIQTDQPGAYEIERLFAGCIAQPVAYRASERIRSHYGRLEIDGIQVEIMRNIQKQVGEDACEAIPVPNI